MKVNKGSISDFFVLIFLDFLVILAMQNIGLIKQTMRAPKIYEKGV